MTEVINRGGITLSTRTPLLSPQKAKPAVKICQQIHQISGVGNVQGVWNLMTVCKCLNSMTTVGRS